MPDIRQQETENTQHGNDGKTKQRNKKIGTINKEKRTTNKQ